MTFATVLQRLAKLENPYPGLRPFETSESHLFFGRDQQVLDLSDRLIRNRFVAVLGFSGSGKSSLVRAGLIPTLQRGRLLEPGRTWRIAQARPSGTPFANLATALNCHPADLRSSSHALIEIAGNEQPLLVLIDQFEELLRYKDRAAGDSATPSEAAAFISLLLASSRSPLPIYVVITMRTDYLGDCAEFPEFPEALNESQYLVPRLTREQRRQAIEGPLGRVQISSALVEQILNDAGDEPDQLPILQHALMRTWGHWRKSSPENDRPISADDYLSVGGFTHALDNHAFELLQTATRITDEPFVEIIFKRLTALGRGNRERRDPAQLSELWELCNAVSDEKRQRVNAVTDVFRQGEATFLTPREGKLAADTYIDIAHESLIRNWRILTEKWLPEEEKQAKTLIQLLDRARGWQAGTRGLLVGLDLSAALEWKSQINPSPKWADHYAGPGAIDEIESFLSASHEKFEEFERQKHLQAEREFAREQQLRAAAEELAQSEKRLRDTAERAAQGEKRLREAAEAKAEVVEASARTTRIFSYVLAALLLGALALAYFALTQRKVAESRELAANAETLITHGMRAEGLDTAIRALSIESTSQAREAVAHAFPQEVTRLEGGSGPVLSASFSSDGQRVVTSSHDKITRVWEVATGQPTVTLEDSPAPVYHAVFSPDGQRVLTAGGGGTARVWDVSTGKVLERLEGHSGAISTAAFSPDGRLVVTASGDKTAGLWDTTSGKLTAKLQGHTNLVHSASFSLDGNRVVTASYDGTARLWEAATGQVKGILDSHSGSLSSAAFSPDGKHVVTASWDGKARVWDAATHRVIVTLEGHSGALNDAEFSPDGQRVVTASDDSTARVWNAATGQTTAILEGHSGYVYTAAFSPDGKRVVTANDDGSARIWNVAAAAQIITKFAGNVANVNSAMLSPDGSRIVRAGGDRTARVQNAITGQVIATLKGHAGDINSAAFSPNGRYVVTASSDRTALVWNVATGRLVANLKGHRDVVISGAFSSDGERVVTASNDKTALVWNVATGGLIANLTGHTDAVLSAAFSADGKRVVTASNDDTARVWDAADGKLIAKLMGHFDSVWSAAFSPNGQQVATASEDGTTRLWDADTGKLISTIRGHAGAAYCAAFSPDGQRLVTAGYDRTARVWSASTGEVIAKIEGHADSVYAAGFSLNGQRVFTASADGTITIFRIVTLDEITRLLASK